MHPLFLLFSCNEKKAPIKLKTNMTKQWIFGTLLSIFFISWGTPIREIDFPPISIHHPFLKSCTIEFEQSAVCANVYKESFSGESPSFCDPNTSIIRNSPCESLPTLGECIINRPSWDLAIPFQKNQWELSNALLFCTIQGGIFYKNSL